MDDTLANQAKCLIRPSPRWTSAGPGEAEQVPDGPVQIFLRRCPGVAACLRDHNLPRVAAALPTRLSACDGTSMRGLVELEPAGWTFRDRNPTRTSRTPEKTRPIDNDRGDAQGHCNGHDRGHRGIRFRQQAKQQGHQKHRDNRQERPRLRRFDSLQRDLLLRRRPLTAHGVLRFPFGRLYSQSSAGYNLGRSVSPAPHDPTFVSVHTSDT